MFARSPPERMAHDDNHEPERREREINQQQSRVGKKRRNEEMKKRD